MILLYMQGALNHFEQLFGKWAHYLNILKIVELKVLLVKDIKESIILASCHYIENFNSSYLNILNLS